MLLLTLCWNPLPSTLWTLGSASILAGPKVAGAVGSDLCLGPGSQLGPLWTLSANTDHPLSGSLPVCGGCLAHRESASQHPS